MKFAALFTVLLLGAACGDASMDPMMPPAMATPPCDPEQAGCTLLKDFGQTALMAGEERDGQCHNWKLNNATDLWVSGVSLDNDGAYHHSNWFFVPEKLYDQPDGIGDCSQLHFDELSAALVGGVLFAQSTQSRTETQRFPSGAVLHIPPYSRIVGSVHLLNASPRATSTGLRLRVSTVPPAQAKVRLAPMRLAYYDLHIPPQQSSEFSATCDLRSAYQKVHMGPFNVQLYFVLPHYHGLGNRFALEVAGGPRSGTNVFELDEAIGEAHGQAFDPPVDLSDSDGLRFTCGFRNPRAQTVGWGIGDQEMCEMLGFIDSAVILDAGVGSGQNHSAGSRDGVALFTGDCRATGFDGG